MRNSLLLSSDPSTSSSSYSLQNPPLPPLPPLPPPTPKSKVKRGPWTPQEDHLLTNYVNKEGEGKWRALPKKAGLSRCGKSCRLRWMNYLRPSVKRGHITADEEDLILRLHRLLGNRWSLIAGRIPGRTDNEIKNYWNTHITKKLISQGIDPKTHRPFLGSSSNTIINSTTNTTTNLSIPIEPITYPQINDNTNDLGKQIITSPKDDDDEDDQVEEEEDVLSEFLNSLVNGEDEGLISPANNPNYLIFNDNNNNNEFWDAETIDDSTFSLINGPYTF